MNKLHIFDVDGTLVYSPLRSTVLNVKGLGQGTVQHLYDKWLDQNKKPKRKWSGWFGRKETLLHPIFPRPLREDMLNREVADEFLASKEDPSVITWIMTGRHMGIRQEVIDILMGYDLITKEDLSSKKVETYFATRTPTLDWKRDTIHDAVTQRGITSVEMWEDRAEHVKAFNEFGQEKLSHFDCSMLVHEVK